MSVVVDEALRREVELELVRREAERDPKALIGRMTCWDERSGVEFRLNMSGEGRWAWQRDVVDGLCGSRRLIVLKARQLGVTWIGVAYGVWGALYRPGSLSLFYRQKEDDAKELVDRARVLFSSLPPRLLNGGKLRVSKQAIEVSFPDGKVSRVLAQSSADASGMGKTAFFVLLDEYAWVENAPAIMKSVSSAAGHDGTVFIVSTANGVYNELTGAGNYFHYLWTNADNLGLRRVFLPWSYHPDRDQAWYETSPEVLSLRPWERKEQYPSTPEEAFSFTDACWFDRGALYWYAANAVREPLYHCCFRENDVGRARLDKTGGMIAVFEEPKPDRRYVMGCDVATGAGLDFSTAYVCDLETMELCAEFHGKLDTDQFAEQLHYLGRWYNTALIGVEDAGGFGNAVIISLRDGRDGRPPYPNMYRHRQFARPDMLQHKAFGFPMTKATRPSVLEHLEECVRERQLPWLTNRLISEMRTFVRYDPRTGKTPSGTWPRAQEGSNDDAVMAAAITLELYRQRGHYENRRKPQPSKRGNPPYPWL